MAIFLNKGKNYLINGGMDFWQRSTSTTLTNGYVAPDRWRFYRLGSNALTISRSTDVPTIEESGYKFNFSSLVTVTTAQASLTGTDGVRILQNIEGNIFEPLAGKEQTFSFWIKTSIIGNYAVSFSNGSADRCFVSTITVNQANTWEKKFVSLTHNTLGTWNYDTSTGLSVCLSLADSASYQSPILNNWISGSYFSHSSCVNFVSTVGATLYVTGFQLEEGNSGTGFSLAGGLIPNEFSLCERYHQRYGGQAYSILATVAAGSSNLARGVISLRTTMRVSPTPSTTGSFFLEGASAPVVNSFTLQPTVNECRVQCSATVTAGQSFVLTANNNVNSLIIFDAEI